MFNSFVERRTVGIHGANSATTFDFLNYFYFVSIACPILEAKNFQEALTAAEKALGSPSKLQELIRQQLLSPPSVPFVSPIQSPPKDLFIWSPDTIAYFENIISTNQMPDVQETAVVTATNTVDTKPGGPLSKGKLKRCDSCLSAFKNAPLDAFSINVQVCGLWFVVCGLWFVVCGLWFVVCGFVVCGFVVWSRLIISSHYLFVDRYTTPKR